MTRLGLAVALGFLIATGAFAEEIPNRCRALRIRPAASDGARRTPQNISARKSKALEVRLAVPTSSASRRVEVRVFTPSGRLYQTLETQLVQAASEQAAPDRRRRRRVRSSEVRRRRSESAQLNPEMPSRRKRFRLRRERRQMIQLAAELRLSGTQIMKSAVYGDWRFEAFIEGFETSCTRPRIVTIEP